MLPKFGKLRYIKNLSWCNVIQQIKKVSPKVQKMGKHGIHFGQISALHIRVKLGMQLALANYSST